MSEPSDPTSSRPGGRRRRRRRPRGDESGPPPDGNQAGPQRDRRQAQHGPRPGGGGPPEEWRQGGSRPAGRSSEGGPRSEGGPESGPGRRRLRRRSHLPGGERRERAGTGEQRRERGGARPSGSHPEPGPGPRTDPGPDRQHEALAPLPAAVAGPGRAARASSELDELTGDHEAPQRWGHDDTDLSPQEARQLCLAPDLPPDPEPDDPDPASAALDEEDGPTGRADPLTAPVYNLVGIKFASAGKIYLCDGGDALYRRGEQVVVETERGPRIGEVAVPGQRRAHRGQIRPILRRPNPHDLRSLERNEERAAQALAVARKYARALRLDIKVFRVEYSLSGNKLLIYFSSEAKVDFRELLRELGRELHTRVELRQTGVRDEAKMVGGIGSCGQTLCCTTWLPSFAPVSIKMAKDQGLVLNPTKVSGQCGRLKCCLVYEQDTYAELRRGLPKLGKRVVTQDGEGRVVEVDVLRQRIRVSLAVGEFKLYQPDEVKPLFPSQQPRHLEPEEGADEDGGEHQ